MKKRQGSFAAALVLTAMTACNADKREQQSDDSAHEVGNPNGTGERSDTGALGVLRVHPSIAAHLAPRAASLGNESGMTSMRIDMAPRADGPTRIGSTALEGAYLDLTPIGLIASAARSEGNAIVFPSARLRTDVVHVIEAGRFEELRVLYDETASTESRWRVRLGPSINSLRLVEGRIDALDRNGRVALVGHPPWAEDANGVRRAVDVQVVPTEDASEWMLSLSLDAHGLAYPIVVDPTWSVVAPMLNARRAAGAITLPDLRVLVAGSLPSTPSSKSTEIYDATLNTWTSAGTMPIALYGPMAPLPGGRALMISLEASPGKAVAWQGGTTWIAASPMNVARFLEVVVGLADGRVLVAGGRDTTPTTLALSSVEIYDASTNAWTLAAPMNEPHSTAAGVLLPSGKVLVLGGEAGGSSVGDTGNHAIATAEIYDPTANTWTYTTPMADRRDQPGAFVVGTKVKVLQGYDTVGAAAGGEIGVETQTTYDIPTATWSTPTTFTRTIQLRPIKLTDGRVAFPGTSEISVYDPATDLFVYGGSNPSGRSSTSVAAIPGGRMLAAGGYTGAGLSNEADVWGQAALGASCGFSYDCLSGACVDGTCCSTTSCAAGSVCNSPTALGTCRKSIGQTCAANSECAGGLCIDSVCCNRACSGQCEACDDPFSKGTCKTIAGAPHGTHTACSDGAGDVCKATVCDGSDATACHAPAAGTVACGVNSCVGGIERHLGTCGSAGACSASSTACGVYACGATTCQTSCTVSTDCAAGYFCSGGACAPVLGLGKPCSDPSACGAPLACVDSVCCGSTACVAGSSCALPGHEGTCIKKAGTKCAVDAECASTFCVDGVCCDARCDGQCEACDNSGSAGTCSATTGTPHGSRTTCARDDKNVCGSTACDGSTRTSCTGHVGAEQSCRVQSCDAASLTQKAACDGKGSCPTAISATCNGFACRDSTSCRTDCRDDGDCVDSYRCESGGCKPATDTCSADGTQAEPLGAAPIPCAPYVCRAGACLPSCGTTADCEAGFVCSFSTKTCVSAAADSTDGGGSGGCSLSSRTGARSGTGSGLVAMVIGISWAVLRRRKRVAALALGMASASCAREGDRTPPEKTPSDAVHVSATAALRTVRDASPSFRRFGTGALRRNTRGLVLEGSPAHGSLKVTLPLSGGDPLHLEIDSNAWLDVLPEVGSVSMPATVEEGAAIFDGLLPHTIVLEAARPDSVEELRMLEGPDAPRTWRYRIRTGPALQHVRVREGRIEALDVNGVVRLATAPMWAVDAAGTRRDVVLTLASAAPNEAVIVATLDGTDLRYPIVVDPTWSRSASMSAPREQHTATSLSDGKVLVTGGIQTGFLSEAPLKSAEIYDPATNTWRVVASMKYGRQNHAAALVSGQVLVVGGDDNASTSSGFPNGIAAAEVFDPVTSTWTDVPSMPAARTFLQAASAGAGKVVVFEGHLPDGAGGTTYPKAAFLYTASTKTWSSAGSLVNTHDNESFVTLPASGAVLLLGAEDTTLGVFTTAVEKYDPATNAWSALAPMPQIRALETTTVLADGKHVLVTGGIPTICTCDISYSSTTIYDSTTNIWTAGPNMVRPRDSSEAALLPNGKVLVFSGQKNLTQRFDDYEIYDPAMGTFTLGGTFEVRIGSTVSTLPDASVLFAGGNAGPIGDFPISATTARFALEPLGSSCSSGEQCLSGSCVDFVCCSSSSCAAGSTCGGVAPGTCTKNDGVTCGSASDCASGFCVDGVCCESACSGECAACDVPGNIGKCRPVKGAPHGGRTVCSATPTTCGLSCDGTDATSCHNVTVGAPCGTEACVAGTESHAGTCSGTGTCNDTPKSCGGFVCDSAACKTTCTAPTDCATGFACSAGNCVPLPGKGKDCKGTSACGAGLTCVDGVCCSTPSCAADSVCALDVGDCRKVKSASCTADGDCVSGHCVDSVCCDGACDGPCGACNLAGREGTCSAVSGAPHGARSCPKDATNPCADGVCNGSDLAKCNVGIGSDVVCKPATCGGGKASKPSFCDGKGACAPPLSSECGAYQCNADKTACRDRCTTATDCVTGAFCRDGKCQLLAGTCSSDGASLVSTDDGSSISCAPFRCADGTCKTSCNTTDDCAPGASCDTDTNACTAVTDTGDSGGGCAFTEGTSTSGSALAGLVALGLVGHARKRRRSGRRPRS